MAEFNPNNAKNNIMRTVTNTDTGNSYDIQDIDHDAIVNQININIDNITAETTRAENAESTLDTKIETETTRAENAENTLNTKIETETTRAENAENTLDTKIETETTRAENAENTLNTKIETETTRAKSAEQDNATNISTLSAGLQAEISDRKSADTTLQNNINTVTTNLATETSDRENADSDLQSKISAVKSTADGNQTDIQSINNRLITAESDGSLALSKATNLEETAVTDVSMTNENGVYSFSKTINGTTSDIGEVNVKEDNCVVELADNVVETTEGLYQNDYHNLVETTQDGTQNTIEQFRIARNQITGIEAVGSALTIHRVNQAGTESDSTINIGTDTPIIKIMTQDVSIDGTGYQMGAQYDDFWYAVFLCDLSEQANKDLLTCSIIDVRGTLTVDAMDSYDYTVCSASPVNISTGNNLTTTYISFLLKVSAVNPEINGGHFTGTITYLKEAE